MTDLGFGVLLWCTFAFFMAGTVKGILGIGVPVVSVSLLSLVIGVPAAVALLPVPILLSNLYQSLFGNQFANTLRRFGLLIFALVVGTSPVPRQSLGLVQAVLASLLIPHERLLDHLLRHRGRRPALLCADKVLEA